MYIRKYMIHYIICFSWSKVRYISVKQRWKRHLFFVGHESNVLSKCPHTIRLIKRTSDWKIALHLNHRCRSVANEKQMPVGYTIHRERVCRNIKQKPITYICFTCQTKHPYSTPKRIIHSNICSTKTNRFHLQLRVATPPRSVHNFNHAIN